MDIVIDANELFSSIIAKGKNKNSRTIEIFFSEGVRLYAPFKIMDELQKNREEIITKSSFSASEYELFLRILKLRITFIQPDSFSEKIREAKNLAPHQKDVEYFALALKINAVIWSEEKGFKDQMRIKVFSTNELWNILSS